MKSYFIIPTTKSHYDRIKAEDANAALLTFTENMDTDMNAYFKAVESMPEGLHSYEYPEGDFCVAMSIIVDTMTENVKSNYYNKECFDLLNLKDIDAIRLLQESYDRIFTKYRPMKQEERDALIQNYYSMLQALTGFGFDEYENDQETLSARICISEGYSDNDAAIMLDEADFMFDRDAGGRFMVHPSDADDILEFLSKNGIHARQVM